MSKYYISADLEGVCGVASPLQCYPQADRSGYEAAVQQLALEVNTVAQAILDIDATAAILVNDAHSTMVNLQATQLLPQIALLSGKPKLCAMMAGLDDTFTAAFLVGYHARAGTEGGVLNHTYHNKLFDVRVNGQAYGEAGINTLYASLAYQVPVVLASGDRAFCQEMKTLASHVRTVETKVGLTTTAAQSHSVASVLEAYTRETQQAVREISQWSSQGDNKALLTHKPPYTLHITFTDSLACDVAMTSPLYKRLDGRTLEFTTDNFQTLFQALQSAYTMQAYNAYMHW